ncbi:gamma-aminobutyric acid type B receptor subunit 2-like [Ruditapes philippinarum]|uniref:gamma-aminobutyric acid type B receptor subunit 2-like n=1 Tax=Ruditapes philippinarum TaxID=129788 RepID=UPI00295ADD62|nr:gamma-aminobutyric acid type B receptor subunit 2-like [Ruditapes philippinarum]
MHSKMLILQLASLLGICGFVDARTPLYVGALFEFSEHWFKDYTPFFPKIIEHAVKGIQNRTDILQDYDLQIEYGDTKGQNGYAATQMIEMVQGKDRPKIAILGPSLSRELIVTGQLAPFLKVIQLSCVATTATTENEDLYPTVFTVNQVPHTLDKLRVEMTRYFGWKLIGTLAFQKEYSTSQIDSFHKHLNIIKDADIELVATAIVANNSNIKYAIERFKENNVRIIHAVFSSTYAPYVFCEAYKQGMYGNSYVWILSGPNMYKDWTNKASLTDCTEAELVTASDGYFTLDYHPIGQTEVTTVNGQTAQDIWNDLEKQAQKQNLTLVTYTGWIYDMVWALAIGLNNSLKYLDQSGLNRYNYSDYYLNAITAGMKDVDFNGMSGRVNFAGTRFRKGDSYIERNKEGGNSRTYIASFLLDNSTYGNESYNFILKNDPWPDGWPLDRFMTKYTLISTNGVAFGLVLAFLTAGLIMSGAFLAFNIYYRNQRSIKMSSPVMNNVIISGCILLYVEVLLSSFSYYRVMKTDTCMIRTWMMAIGFTTLFGALFSKTYRIYAIFRDGRLKLKIIKDYQLIAKVGVLLAIDSIILIPWTIFHPQVMKEFSELDKKIENKNVLHYTVYLHCNGDYEVYWFGILYIYKGLLLVIGTFLAWETRTVHVAELNDSKFIGACIYNVVVICVFGVPLAHVLSVQQMTISFVLNSCLIIFCTTICQCIIFIPKIRNRNQVHGKFIIPSLNASSSDCSRRFTKNSYADDSRVICTGQNTTEEKSMEDIKEENETLRMQIAKEAIAMAKLRKTLLDMTGDLHIYKSNDKYVVFRKNTDNGLQESNVDFA